MGGISIDGDDFITSPTTKTSIASMRGTGVPSPKSSFGDVKLVSYEDINWCINPTPRRVPRFKTGIGELDNLLGGGIPKGLTTFYGEGGSGKTLLAREIAKLHNTMYLCCEVVSDAPQHDEFPNVTVVDYTQYPVNVSKALSQLFTFINELKPELVVIDSMTGFFSQSSKALPESDVREMVWKVHTACDGKIPIIGISEVRGQGFSRAPAGGQGVMHGCSMLIDFQRIPILYEGQKEIYDSEYGDVVYKIQVSKDKGNAASIYPQKIMWTKETGYHITPIRKTK